MLRVIAIVFSIALAVYAAHLVLGFIWSTRAIFYQPIELLIHYAARFIECFVLVNLNYIALFRPRMAIAIIMGKKLPTTTGANSSYLNPSTVTATTRM